MRFTFTVGGTTIVATAEQLEAISRVLEHCDCRYDKSVEKGQGTHGYNNCYIHHLKPFNCAESLNLKVMPTEQYEATKLITKLNKED